MPYSLLPQSIFDLLQVYNGPWRTSAVSTSGNDDITSALPVITGGNGHDRITGTGALIQAINGGEGSDQIFGMGGQDNINGANGNDFIEGGAGGGAGLLREQLRGGAGIDTLSYEHSAAGVTVNMSLLSNNNNNITVSGGDADYDLVFNDFENVVGSNQNDFISANDEPNKLFGLGGIDSLNGLGGNDSVWGGDGNDFLFGGLGADILDGGNGNDTLHGEQGDDTLIGGAGADFLDGGDGYDTADYSTSTAGVKVQLNYSGEGGDAAGDTLLYIESVIGSTHNDDISGSEASNELRGGDGNDLISYGIAGVPDMNNYTGGAGADTLICNEGGESLDRIIYENVSDSTPTAFDKVFMDSRDQIDLELIDANKAVAGSQQFEWKDTAAFTGAGQLRYRAEGDHYVVEGNVDTNLGVDFQIQTNIEPVQDNFLL